MPRRRATPAVWGPAVEGVLQSGKWSIADWERAAYFTAFVSTLLQEFALIHLPPVHTGWGVWQAQGMSTCPQQEAATIKRGSNCIKSITGSCPRLRIVIPQRCSLFILTHTSPAAAAATQARAAAAGAPALPAAAGMRARAEADEPPAAAVLPPTSCEHVHQSVAWVGTHHVPVGACRFASNSVSGVWAGSGVPKASGHRQGPGMGAAIHGTRT